MRLTRIEKLAEDLNKSVEVCTKMLGSKGISVFDGYYDAALYEAVMAESPALQRKRIDWGLSPRLGLGMVKEALEPLGVHISIHDPKGPQWLMLRKGTARSYVKWHYSNTFGVKSNRCNFEVRNFNTPKAPQHYLFTCFSIGIAWAVPQKVLVKQFTDLSARKDPVTPDAVFAIPTASKEHPGGCLKVRFDVNSSAYVLNNAKQLGF